MRKITRRQFLKGAAATGVGLALPLKFGGGTAWAVNNSPNLRKWIQPMRQLDILSTPLDNSSPIPTITGSIDPLFPNTNLYKITAGEFLDQLHPNLNSTRLWGYAPTTPIGVGVQRHLGGVIVANRGTASRLRIKNTLPATHIIPLDTTIPGALGAPNRIAVHLHGGYVPWIGDGGPFDWWTPAGVGGLSFQNGPGSLFDNPLGSIAAGEADYFYPNDQSTRLMWYHDHAFGTTRINAYAGLATGYLVLDAINASYYQPATGFPNGKIPPLTSTYPLVFQDKIFVNPTTIVTDPTWYNTGATAVVPPRVQVDGSLWYEHVYDPKLFRLLKAKKYLVPPNPSCIPEFFGDTMLANGLVYPTVSVEAKRYRFLILNACNARFLNINLFQVAPNADVTTNPKTGFALLGTPIGPPIIQIGTEGGFLVAETSHPNNLPFNPATLTGNLLLAPAERADIIIDFSTVPVGTELMMYNDAPGPFPAGPPNNDYYLGNPKNPIQPLPGTPTLPGTGPDTRNILRFKVVQAAAVADPQPAGAILNPALVDPPLLVPYPTTVAPIPAITPPASIGGQPVGLKDLTLNEDFDQYGRLRQMIGTTAPALVGKGFGLEYLAPPTEIPAAGAIEVWRIFNLTADSHPIHIHLINCQVLSRQPFKVVSGIFTPTGLPRGPEPNELGWKETVQMHPGEVTSVIMKFDLPAVPFPVPSSNRATIQQNVNPWGMGLPATQTYNEYVYHCHILEHEEHDMMRPLVVTGAPLSVTFVQEISGSAGGTATYFISGGTAPYSITTNNAIYTPVPTVTGFTVGVLAFTVPTGVATPAATFTITDSAATPATVFADLFVV